MNISVHPVAAAAAHAQEQTQRRLTILAIGHAESTHVRARVGCFAARGHKVFLLTETGTESAIPGVTQLVPALDRSTRSGRVLAALTSLGLKVFGFSTEHAWRALAFLKFLRATRPDIVHVHFAYAYYGWMAALMGCRPLVVTVMGGDVLFEEQGAPIPHGKWLTLQLLRNADYVTSKSNYLTAALHRFGGINGRIERIFWGIPLAKLGRGDPTPLRSALGFLPDQRLILSPRILQPFYQVHLIVEAMPRVLARHPNAVLMITEYVADLEYRAQIVSRVNHLGIAKSVRFCGTVPHAKMPEYYWASEVAVSVPRSDGMPQTLIEAMACETCNVLINLPHYHELVAHDESAYFVEGDPENIADGINRLLDDGDLRKRIVRNALAIVQQHGDLDEQAARVERRYRELAGSVRPRIFRWRHFLSTVSALRNAMAAR